MKKYYTVPEFAKLVGITNQGAYLRLKKDLVKFCKQVNGKKMVSTEALQFFTRAKIDKEAAKEISSLEATLDLVSKQLVEKDEQIRELTKALIAANDNNRVNQMLFAERLALELPNTTKKQSWWKFWEKSER
jgi:hypothetical protein